MEKNERDNFFTNWYWKVRRMTMSAGFMLTNMLRQERSKSVNSNIPKYLPLLPKSTMSLLPVPRGDRPLPQTKPIGTTQRASTFLQYLRCSIIFLCSSASVRTPAADRWARVTHICCCLFQELSNSDSYSSNHYHLRYIALYFCLMRTKWMGNRKHKSWLENKQASHNWPPLHLVKLMWRYED